MNSPGTPAEVAADPSRSLAEGIASIRYETLPATTVAAAQRLILDSLAVALAGRGGDDVEALLALAGDWGGNPQAAILGSRLRVPAPAAALVNGTMIQALDFDDTHDVTAGHKASTVLAAALAVCEARGRSGRDLIASVTAGVEMAVRVGLAPTDKIGWTGTAVYGAFGAAAAAAHALGLDAARTRHAFGIVLSQTAGTTQTALDWPLSKHMQSGFMAKAGVLSALLAERGVTGVEGVFEGKFGFYPLYKGGRYSAAPLHAPWGTSFHIEDLALKPYPSCRATHTSVDAALALAPRLEGEVVESIRIVVPPVAHQLAGKKFSEGDNPIISAQFSIEYTVATALLRRGLSLKHFHLDAIRDPAVRALVQRCRVEIGEAVAEFAPATIEITCASGKRLAHTATEMKGDRATPLSEEELTAKIVDCLEYAPAGTTNVDAAGLRRVVAGLADSSTAALIAALTPGS